ncbi:hypothetical protein BKA62DRAFT_643693 [Auriculariales sp. MPI-PUGE-AT-0066]|nr:hypothetical protein BKA62DRAFT_643693 [Auriculariales sp. MPI-PUGE-AT-0066]
MLAASALAIALAFLPTQALATTRTLSSSISHEAGRSGIHGKTTLSLSGPSGALSDITTAGGWSIEGCSSDWSSGAAQVTIVCTGTQAQQAVCSQLFDDGGAVDTIVKLPENCGTGLVARVVSSVDITTATKFLRGPETHAVVLDYNFSAIKTQRGSVTFSISTSQSTTTSDSGSELAAAKRWEIGQMFDLPPVSVDKSYNLFQASISCPAIGNGAGFSAAVSVDTNVHVNANIALGFKVTGTIIPPAIDTMQILGTLNGSASGEFIVNAQATGTFDTGLVPLYEVVIAGVDIPGILQIGPKFGVYGRLNANLGVEALVKAGVAWTFPDVEVAFPQNSGASKASAIQTLTPLVVSLDPTATATGVVTAGLTPRLSVGIDILSGLAEATVYLDVTASAELDLNIEGHAHAEAPIDVGTGEVDTSATGGASGCASLDVGVDITVGARGAIPPIFDEEISYTIYAKHIEVFNECFGAGDAATSTRARSLERRAFTCPALGLKDLLELIHV